MCIILSDSEHPDATHLISFPTTYNDNPSRCLLYINDLSKVSNDETVMIVAVPNQNKGFLGLGLVDIKPLKGFIKQTKAFLPENTTLSTYSTFGMSTNQVAAIHDVGDYKISVVHSVEDIIRRIDWKNFKKPQDFQTRINTLNDRKLFPFSCSYVVAQTTKSIKDSGFGIIYPENNYIYYPICHENSNLWNYNSYNVKIYHYDNKKVDLHNFKQNQRSDIVQGRKIAFKVVSSDRGIITNDYLNVNNLVLSATDLKGFAGPNQNILINKSS